MSKHGVAIRLFVTCWLVYSLHFATNTVREIYPALTLGDRLSFDVSEYLGMHDDIFEMPGRGVFINNNPGASILGAIPYALARPLIDNVVARVQAARAASAQVNREYNSVYPMARKFYEQARERGLDVKFALAAGVMQVFLMAPLSALSAVVMFYILVSRALSVRQALLLSVLYAFATPVFFRTGQLNHNLIVGHCAFFAFALLWRPWSSMAHPQRPWYLLAGLLSGWAVVLDYSGVLVVGVLGLYAVVHRWSLPAQIRRRDDLVRFGSGVATSIAVLMAYQWLAFGNPFLPAQRYMPPTEFSNYGYNGMGWPQPDLLWETAFGMRFGLFTSAPLLLLALWAPSWWSGRTRFLGVRERWCIVFFSLAFFFFAAANEFGRLQFNSGVRYVVPVTPFVFLLAASVLMQLPRFLSVLVAIFGVYWSWCLAMYRDVEQGLGILESVIHVTLEGVRLPWLATLERLGYVPSGVYAVPLVALCGIVLWVLWRADLRVPRKGQPFRVGSTAGI